MSSIFKKILIVVTLSLVLYSGVRAMESGLLNSTDDTIYENYEYIEDAKLASSRYTRVEDMSLVDPDLFIDIRNSDDWVATKGKFELYYDDNDVEFKVLNTDTGYVWSSIIDGASAGTYTELLESSIAIEYIEPQKDMKVNENIGLSSTVYTVEEELIADGIKLSIYFGGFCENRTCSRAYEDKYLTGEITLEEMMETYAYSELGISLDLIVTLTEEGLKAEVPYESIVEDDPETFLVSSVMIFPGLGGTEMDLIPGYMVIPDGAGALIRYEDNEDQFNTPYEEYFFGENYGLDDLNQSVTNYPLSMPIFGAVHGIDQNAFVGIIESGAMNARLLAIPNGARNIDYNVIFTKFDIRQVYRQSFSSDGSGGAMKYLDTSMEDMIIQYNFLDGDDANYVGIGTNYREYLNLQKAELEGDINLFIQYLMADSESSFFGSSLVKMSTVDEVMEMYQYFMDQGITDQLVNLMGWNEGGYSGHLPSDIDFENSLGSNSSFRELIELINQENSIMLENNYIVANNTTAGISYRNDVAKGSNRFKLEYFRSEGVYTDIYVLYPETSRDLAVGDYSDYLDENVEAAFTSMASILFSYYDSDYYNRIDAFAYYIEVIELYQEIAHYFYPFSYAYQYTNSFLDAPLYNSQLKYFDDVVPLISVVLHGTMDLYAMPLNFNSLGRETILNLIDYGYNPTYILTYEESSELKDTDLQFLYTSEFDLWKTSIVEDYNYINDALKHVNGAFIQSRVVLELGVVRVTYDNGVSIFINYTSTDYTDGSLTVPAMDYFVGGVS